MRPPGCRELTAAEKGLILGRFNEGANINQIAREMNRDPRTIQTWIGRGLAGQANLEWHKSLPRSGRPETLNAAQRQEIVEEITDEPLRIRSFPKEKAQLYNCHRVSRM